MNTLKQINVMVAVLFLLLIAAGAYTLYDPFRSESAEDRQLDKTVERGAHLFALNCRVCHGDRGQGGGAGGRLGVAPPLDNEQLRGFDANEYSEDELKNDMRLVENTIACGRAGTFMPTWGQSQGGTLNEEQVRQLTVFITGDPEGDYWRLAQEVANEQDAEATEHATVEMPDGSLDVSETELVVSNAKTFNADQAIRIGEEDEEERLRILEIPSTGHNLAEKIGRETRRFQVSGVQERETHLRVERGIDDSPPAPHPANAPISFPPEADAPENTPDTPTGETLLEAASAQDELLVVSGALRIRAGDSIRIGLESMRVTEVEKARRPVEPGDILRVEGELMQVEQVTDDGDTGVVVAETMSSTAERIQVSDANRLRKQDVIRIDDELLRIVQPATIERTLRQAIGRADEEFPVSGLIGIDEGMIIRLEGEERFTGELMRVVELRPARITVARAFDDTDEAVHEDGSPISSIEAPPEGARDQDEIIEDTEQTLVEPVGTDDTVLVVTGTEGITIGGAILIGDERMVVEDVEQATLRVERGVEGSEPMPHASGIEIFDDNFLDVERGFAGSNAATHEADAPVFRFVVLVQRAVEGSELADHSPGAELFLGNRLVVERGIRDSEPREHENGSLVFNFPEPPDEPATTGTACGQLARPAGDTTPSGDPTPTPAPNAQELTIVARNLLFDQDSLTVPAGAPAVVHLDNQDQGVDHNFAVYEEEGGDGIAIGDICRGPCENDVPVEPLDAGTYFFRCDIHPTTMTGDYVVQ